MPLSVDIAAPSEPRALAALLEGGTRLNELLLDVWARNGRPAPRLYDAGVSYERERGTEKWWNIAEVMKAGHGDCEDLAMWRAAELRRDGEVGAYVDVVVATNKRGYHAIVRRADGSTEDPSLMLLGKRPEDAKMHKRNTVIDVSDDGECYIGEIEVPTEGGDVAVRARGDTGAEAVERAANVAQSIMDDPMVAPFVPPQAHAAVQAAKLLAKAAGSGLLSSLFGRLRGHNKRKLAETLLQTTHGDHRGVGTLSLGAGGVVVGPGTGRGGGRPATRKPVRITAGGGGGGQPGFVWVPADPYTGVPGHWERAGGQAQYPSDPYAQPPYYGGYNPYGQGTPYGGYPPMDPYAGYGPYAPVDPWAMYSSYGWAPSPSPWGQGWDTVMMEQFGSQVLDAMWPSFREQG